MTGQEEGTPESIPALGSRKELHLKKSLFQSIFPTKNARSIDRLSILLVVKSTQDFSCSKTDALDLYEFACAGFISHSLLHIWCRYLMLRDFPILISDGYPIQIHGLCLYKTIGDRVERFM